ncbi:MAG: hypothetical protein ACE5FJ_02450 [Gemmatimonadales bacterium]
MESTDPIPTNLMPRYHSDDSYVRVVFDRGLQILRSDQGWLIPSSKSRHFVDSPEEIEERFAAKRITVYRDLAPFLYPRKVMDRDGLPLSRPRYLSGYVEDAELRIYKYMVEHLLFTGVTHLAYLAEAYAGLAVLKNHSEWQIGEDAVVTSSRQLYNSALLHAESTFAALVSSFNASRYLMWRRRGEPPEAILETISHLMLDATPEMERTLTPIEDAWCAWGDKITAYRDCITRYHSVEPLGGGSAGELLFDDIWEIRIDLPDNPGARAEEFTFTADVDALQSCWDACVAVVRTLETCLPRVFQLARLDDQPRRWLS